MNWTASFSSFRRGSALSRCLPARRPDAAVRVMLDDKPLFENAEARGDERPRDLSLDVRGGKRLTLEVDFGRDQDVGDRVVWANARLVRADQ